MLLLLTEFCSINVELDVTSGILVWLNIYVIVSSNRIFILEGWYELINQWVKTNEELLLQ